MAKDISFSKLKYYWQVYLFVLPSVVLVGLFSYYPAASAMYHAFYRWNGEDINYFVGDLNLKKAMGNYWLWIITLVCFFLVLFFAKKDDTRSNFFRILGGIFSLVFGAGALASRGLAFSRMTDLEAGKILGSTILVWGTVLFFFKLLISEENDMKWIWVLIPFEFILAGILSGTGFSPEFSWMLVLLFTGFYLWLTQGAQQLRYIENVRTFHAFAALGVCFWALAKHSGGDPVLWGGFNVIFILVLFNIVKMLPSIITAVVINRLTSDKMSYFYKVLFVVPMIIPGMVTLLLWKFFFDANVGLFNRILVNTGIMKLLIYMDQLMGWGGVFKEGVAPVWLGNEHLVLPAIILWGFPWVGIVGVLIYLAGLQGIPTSVYEAANLDGASSIQKFLHIELPLIMTQIRINMVLMIIGTLKMYAFILILFGTGGGPNGKLMVPGLFMFTNAFQYGQAGYACAIGLIIFFFILLLTELNNRYIRVEK